MTAPLSPAVAVPAIIPLSGLEAAVEHRPWAWAEANRAAIETHWARLVAQNPSLFNGTVLVADGRRFEGGVYRATYFPISYASFLAWRDFGFPDGAVSNGFAMAALRSADGAFVLGVMGGHTANPGRVYFPAGTPDLDDVLPDGRLDLAGSTLRELEEETGVSPDEVTGSNRWTAVVDGPRTALMHEMRSPLEAGRLVERIEAFLARDPQPELAGIRLVRSPADIDAQTMPLFMQAYLHHALGREGEPPPSA